MKLKFVIIRDNLKSLRTYLKIFMLHNKQSSTYLYFDDENVIIFGHVPSKIYPGYPGDIPDIFFDFFNKNFPENISGVSGVKVSKSLKEKFEG